MTTRYTQSASRALLALGLGSSTLAAASDLPPWLTERRIIGRNNLERIEAAIGTSAYTLTRVVARVETSDGMGFCTASRVAENLFLTNYHCFEFTGCENLQFHLGYEKALPAKKQLIFRCQELLAKNETYDYALYRVDFLSNGVEPTGGGEGAEESLDSDETTAKPEDYPTAVLWAGSVRLNQPLIVASHPRARLKENDRSDDCKLRTINTEVVSGRQTITHTCDTEGGSSGSPLFDREHGYVVGLHWGGTNEYNMSIPMNLVVQDLERTLSPEVFSELTIER